MEIHRRGSRRRGSLNDRVREGEQVFRSIGCAVCHVPTLQTGSHYNPVFDRQPVHLHSDLLLHDVGTGDGIEQGAARANEIRTPVLWGLRLRPPFLHDGSAATIDEAIGRHQGEAAGVINRYRATTATERAVLLEYLRSL